MGFSKGMYTCQYESMKVHIRRGEMWVMCAWYHIHSQYMWMHGPKEHMHIYTGFWATPSNIQKLLLAIAQKLLLALGTIRNTGGSSHGLS